MIMNQRTETEINEIINSIDNITRAEVSPYFNSTLNGRLQKVSDIEFTGRLVIILAASVLLLLLNTFFLNRQFNNINTDETISLDKNSYTYQLNTTNYNYDIKEK
jgi:hypothetical protein